MNLAKYLLVAPLGLFAACAPTQGSVAVNAPVYAAPNLAYVGPGVEVVSDWDSPVFFADDFFWAWDDGLWYRSSVLGGERIRVREIPVSVARIDRPGRYAHFHADMHASRPMPTMRMRGTRMASRHR